MTRFDETWHQLPDWTQGQPPSERLGFGNCWSPRRQDDPAVDVGVQGIPVGPIDAERHD